MWFHSKDEITDFHPDISNDNRFKLFKYKAKLLGNIDVDNANKILKHATIFVSLNFLSNFWRSLEMPLANCKVELKCKWTKYYILPAAVADNANGCDGDNNIIFIIKNTKLLSLL